MASASKPFKVVSDDFHISKVESEVEFEQAMVIRFKVFCDEQGYNPDDEKDEYVSLLNSLGPDEDLTRETATSSPIGTVRFLPSRSKLGRLCVLPEARKHRLGAALVRAVKDYAVRAGMNRGEQEVQISCHAQAYVVGFYEKLGYRSVGERFLEEGTEHQKMVLTVPI